MKKLLLSIAAVFYMAALFSQADQPGSVTSGKITYEEKVKLNIKIDGDAPQIDLPKERKSEKILTFSGDATLFEDGKNDLEDQMESQHADGNVRIRMVMSGENKTYTDMKSNIVTDQRDFMNRIFLVEKQMNAPAWKVTGQQKEILGYTCFEATTQDTSGNKTVAWFAPDIKVSSGPAGLGSLPGMILAADINSGSRIYTATAIEPATSGEIKIQKPREGKKVTEPEYKAIVAEKMKEMGMEGGSGNQMRVVIRHQ
jgi:GLPGLI family protein